MADSPQAPGAACPPAAGATRLDQRAGAPAGYGREKKAGAQAVGRSRGGNTTKLHLTTDGAGNVLGWQLTPGPAGDCPEAAGLLAPWPAPAQQVVADAAYDSDALRAQIAAAGAVAVIKPNPRRKHMPHFDPLAYAQRHHIEQTINKLKHFRRVATRYDKLDSSYNAFVALRVSTSYLN
nr:IS5 family transposase [Hymenobacter edaphi]